MSKKVYIYDTEFGPNRLFATDESFDALVSRAETYNGSEGAIAMLFVGLTVNTFIAELNKHKVGEAERDDIEHLIGKEVSE
jgi:hypothetical protein